MDWELKGVPVRVEVGPRELAAGQVTLVRRDIQEKRTVPLAASSPRWGPPWRRCRRVSTRRRRPARPERTRRVKTLDEAAEAAADGFAVLPWDRARRARARRSWRRRDSAFAVCRAPDGSLAAGDDESGLLAVVARAY